MVIRSKRENCARPSGGPGLGGARVRGVTLPKELRALLDPLEVARPGTVLNQDLFVEPAVGPAPRLHPDAWAALVPAELLRALEALVQQGKRVLVVGDRPGDADCFSGIALARFLRHLGIEADTHVGVKPPREIENLIEPGELLTEEQVRAKQYDAIIFVDNDGTGPRISPAAHEAAAKAGDIFVIDHHAPRRYPVREGQGLHPWIETRADAAALLQLGLMTKLAKKLPVPLSRDQWARIAEPLLAGLYSDTGGLAQGSTKSGALATYSFLADLLGESAVEAIRRGFDAELPPETSKAVRTGIEHRLMGEAPHRAMVCSFLASEHPVDLNSGDLYRAVLHRVDELRDEHRPSISLTLVGLPADEAFGDRVLLSVRTMDGKQASRLAKELGDGGGKANGQAGATVLVREGQTLDALMKELLARTESLLELSLKQARRLSEELRLRGGNL